MCRSRKIFLIMSFVIWGICGSLNAGELSLNDRVWILTKTYQSISVYFAHWETAAYGPESVDSVFQIYLKRAIEARDRGEFTRIIREYLALLQNGHCWFTDFAEYRDTPPLGFDWEYLEGNWIITETRVPGLEAGDIVDSINGESAEGLYQKLKKYVSSSSDRSRRVSFLDWALKAYVPNSYSLIIRDQRGNKKNLTVDRSAIAPVTDSIKTTGIWKKEPDVAYIKIPSFAQSDFEEAALAFVESYSNAKCIIIDVRGNGGGNTPSQLIDNLMDRPYRWYAESTPLSIAVFRYYAETDEPWWNKFLHSHLLWMPSYESSDSVVFKGKVIILVDRRTGSAAEDFVVTFKDNKRALIIGEQTMGSTGQPYIYRFGDIGSLGIGAKRAYFPDGSPFEGVGISPDIVVINTRDEIYKVKDVVLERAIKEATQ